MRATWIHQFVNGALADEIVAQLEEHLEGCEECFGRMAAAAGQQSEPNRESLKSRLVGRSGIECWLSDTSVAPTVYDSDSGAPVSALPRSFLRTIGPYRVVGFLGVGGMSVVYRAQHQETGRELAVKTVKTPVVASSLAMLRQEIEFLRQARHPGIVSVLDSDWMADEPWYAMELFDTPRLHEFNRELWRSRGGFEDGEPDVAGRPRAAGGSLVQVLRLFARLCEPIDFIHRSGLVHGDIKPSNVFVRNGEQPVLMDFGLASQAKGSVGREALDVTGKLRGTLQYIAPEIIRGQIPDARADLYALGCMLYESIVGTPPFVSAHVSKILDMHLNLAPTPTSQLTSDVTPELDELLLRLLAKNPFERFGHAHALGASLSSIADAMSSDGAKPRKPPSERPAALFRPPLVGRDPELAFVMDCVRKARASSSGALFLVSGESGIGKTFFAVEVAQRASLEGFQVITSECVALAPKTPTSAADAGAPPLQGFRKFFQALRERCRERGPDEAERLFGDRLGLLGNYVPVLRLLRDSMHPGAVPPALPAQAGRERIVAAVVDTLVAYAQGRPLLLALDDLQWADELTLAVLERLDDDLLSRLPLIVIGTFRSDEDTEPVRRIASKPWIRALHLKRLQRTHIRGLVGGMLSMSAPPESLVEYVDAHAEGIPFYAAEYLRSLVAAGALAYESSGTWSTKQTSLDGFRDAPQFPRNLQELIRSRLDRLPPEVIEVLEAGAVLGRTFSLPLVGRIVAREASTLPALLAPAVATQVTSSVGIEAHVFLHDKLRETLYAGLAPARRSALHLAAAHALESESPIPSEQYATVAHHFRHGGEQLHALEYLEKAGAHALSIAANAESERFLRDALEIEATLSPRQPALRRARWYRQQGDALQGLGRMADSARALKASAALLGRPFPEGRVDFAARLAREIAIQFWHRLAPRGVKPLEGEEREVNAEVMRVFERMHEVSYYLGRDADLVLSTTVSLNSSERGGPTPSLAIAYSNAAMMAGVLPIPKLADEYFRLASAAIGHSPDLPAESWLLEMEGHYRGWQGRRDQAFAYLERAIVLAREGGFFRRSDEAESVLIGLNLFAGFHAAVLARTPGVERSGRKRNDYQVQCWATLQRAEAQLIRGALEAALAEIVKAGEVLPSLGRPEQIWANGLEAYIQFRLGKTALAAELVKRGISLADRGSPVHSYCVGSCARLAETAIALYADSGVAKAERSSRKRLAERSCAILERAARVFPNARPVAALHRGLLDLTSKKRDKASVLVTFREAAQLSHEFGLPYHELRLRSALRSLLDERDPDAPIESQRVAELTSELEIEADAFGAGSIPAPLASDGRVQVERERQQPTAL